MVSRRTVVNKFTLLWLFQIFFIFQFFGQIGLFVVFLIIFSVFKTLHELRRRVADFKRDREIAEFFYIIERGENRIVCATVFLALREIGNTMGETNSRLRITD